MQVGSQPLRQITGVQEASQIRAAQADPAAFGALYQQYLDRVYAYMRARTQSEEDAADLAQQVFLRAMDALPRFRGNDESFAPWLFRIARSVATDAHRRRRETLTWDLVPKALHPQSEAGLDALVERAEDVVRLRTLFIALDAPTRELLVLRFTAGLSVAQIATVIGKSEAATQKRLSRTIQRLKEQYHDHTR